MYSPNNLTSFFNYLIEKKRVCLKPNYAWDEQKKGIVDGQIEVAERKRCPSLLQQMNPHSQHVILKKLNKEKFLASGENDIL